MPKKLPAKNIPVRINSYKLFHRRHSVGMNLSSLAKLTAISESKLSQFETPNGIPEDPNSPVSIFPIIAPEELATLAKVLNVPPQQLQAGRSNDFLTEVIAYMKAYSGSKAPPQGVATVPSGWKARAVVFDFDGTLTAPGSRSTRTTWETIWEKAGYDVNDCGVLATQFFSEKINHSQWCQLTLDKFKAKGLSRNDVASAAENINLIDGFEECIDELVEMGIPIYIVSGSIWDVLVIVLDKYMGKFQRIEANHFAYDRNEKLAKITGTRYDFEGKKDFLEEIACELGIKTSDVLFIGNSINDIKVKKSGARTLLVNPHFVNPSDGNHWDHYLPHMDSLIDIMEFVDADWKKNREKKVQAYAEVVRDDLLNIKSLTMQDYVVIGDYTRHSEEDRSFLVGLADKIRRPLITKSTTRENFLLFAPPGSGKTFFISELAREFKMSKDLEYVEIDVSRDDESACKDKLRTVENSNKPCLCLIDEIDGRKSEDWPYDLFYKKLDLNERQAGLWVFVLVGSSGGSVESLGAIIKARIKGGDLVDRILQSNQHCSFIPPMKPADAIVVFAKKVLEASASAIPQKDIREIGRSAAFFALMTCKTPRQIKMLSDQAVRRVPIGHTQLLFDHLFEAADKSSKDAFEEQYKNCMNALGMTSFRVTR
jgi:phosphoserine phosphatase